MSWIDKLYELKDCENYLDWDEDLAEIAAGIVDDIAELKAQIRGLQALYDAAARRSGDNAVRALVATRRAKGLGT
jgi:hypothetical protein